MERVTYRLTMDLDMVGKVETIYLKDTCTHSIQLVVRLQKDGEPYEITDACVVSAAVSMPGETVNAACTLDDGEIVFDLNRTIPAGKTVVEFVVSDSTGYVFTTPSVCIISAKSIYDEEAGEATEEFDALQLALARAKDYEERSIESAVVTDNRLVITFADGAQYTSESLKGDSDTAFVNEFVFPWEGELKIALATNLMQKANELGVDETQRFFIVMKTTGEVYYASPQEVLAHLSGTELEPIFRSGSTVSGEELKALVQQYFEENPPAGGTTYQIGDGLKLDAATNTLSVDTAEAVEADNTKPITSAAVHVTVGNINALLETI